MASSHVSAISTSTNEYANPRKHHSTIKVNFDLPETQNRRRQSGISLRKQWGAEALHKKRFGVVSNSNLAAAGVAAEGKGELLSSVHVANKPNEQIISDTLVTRGNGISDALVTRGNGISDTSVTRGNGISDTSTSGSGVKEEQVIIRQEPVHVTLEQRVQWLSSSDPQECKRGARLIQIFCTLPSPDFSKLIALQAIPKLMWLYGHTEDFECKRHCLWALANIASGERNNEVKSLMEANAVEVFIHAFQQPQHDLHELATLGLGNIAGDPVLAFRRTLLKTYNLADLVGQCFSKPRYTEELNKKSMATQQEYWSDMALLCTNLCRKHVGQVIPLIPVAIHFIQCPFDLKIVQYGMEAIYGILGAETAVDVKNEATGIFHFPNGLNSILRVVEIHHQRFLESKKKYKLLAQQLQIQNQEQQQQQPQQQHNQMMPGHLEREVHDAALEARRHQDIILYGAKSFGKLLSISDEEQTKLILNTGAFVEFMRLLQSPVRDNILSELFYLFGHFACEADPEIQRLILHPDCLLRILHIIEQNPSKSELVKEGLFVLIQLLEFAPDDIFESVILDDKFKVVQLVCQSLNIRNSGLNQAALVATERILKFGQLPRMRKNNLNRFTSIFEELDGLLAIQRLLSHTLSEISALAGMIIDQFFGDDEEEEEEAATATATKTSTTNNKSSLFNTTNNKATTPFTFPRDESNAFNPFLSAPKMSSGSGVSSSSSTPPTLQSLTSLKSQSNGIIDSARSTMFPTPSPFAAFSNNSNGGFKF